MNKYYKDKYQVILIGASLANMSCALELKNQGIDDILILEQHNLPGGLATSFVRSQVEFELSLHEMMSIGKDNMLTIGQFLKRNNINLKWIRVNEAFRLVSKDIDFTLHPSIDGSFILPSREIAKYDKENTNCYKQVLSFFKACHNVYLGLKDISKNKVKTLFKYPELIKFSGCSAKDVMDFYHLDKITQDIISAYFIYLGNIPSNLPAIVFADMIAEYIGYGSYVPEKYSYSLSLSLYEACLKKGIQIELDQIVEKVLVNDNTAFGVRLDNGVEIKSDYLVSGVYPNKLYKDMIQVKDEIQKKMNKFVNSKELGLTCFSLIMLLNKSVEELNIQNYCTFYLKDSLDYDNLWNDFSSLDKSPFLISTCLNKVNDKYIPKGKTVYSITYLPKVDYFKDVDEVSYEKVKHDIARRFIEIEEKRLNVNLSNCIEEITMVTPLSILHFTGDSQGSIYGYMHSLTDNVVARMTMSKEDQFIKNLYFAGASSLYGDGMAPAMTSGIYVANEISKMNNKGVI